jgi:hypothetical protein
VLLEGKMEEFLQLAAAAGVKVPKLCSVSGQTVTCLYGTPVRPYERIILAINVTATAGAPAGVSEVSVSGGATAPVLSRRTLDPGETVPSYGVENYELVPEEEGGGIDTQAGSHPFQLTTTFALNTQTVPAKRAFEDGPGNCGETESCIVPEVQPLEIAKDLRFDLPPGLIGNPTPLPKCSMHVFITSAAGLGTEAESCPADTVVGVATPIVTNVADSAQNIPYVFSTPLYSLEPAVGEPARFGFATLAGPVILDTAVRTGGDYGVVVTVPNIISLIPVMGSQVTFWGVPADPRHDYSRGEECLEDKAPKQYGGTEFSCPVQEKPQPLIIMPTSCNGPLHTTFVVGERCVRATERIRVAGRSGR